MKLAFFAFVLCWYINTTVCFRTIYSSKFLISSSLKVTKDELIPGIADLQYGLGKFAFSLLPLSPESIGRRKTIFKEVVKDQIWTLDQIQGIINVNGELL